MSNFAIIFTLFPDDTFLFSLPGFAAGFVLVFFLVCFFTFDDSSSDDIIDVSLVESDAVD